MRLFYIEDNPGDIELVRERLVTPSSGRFSLEHAGSLAGGLAAMERSAPDVALLDLSLPDADGFDGLEALQRLHQSLPVVVLTGNADADFAMRALQRGAQDYLVKGQATSEMLERSIRYAFGRKQAERRLATQHAVARILAEAERIEDAAPKLLEAIGDGLAWSAAALWVPDEKAGVLRCAASWHAPGAELSEFDAATRARTFARGEGLPGRAWESGRPEWIADVSVAEIFVRRADALKADLHAGLCVPVKLGERTIAVLKAFHRRAEAPDSDVIGVVTSLASQIGQFMERRRAEDATRASEELFRQMADAIREVFWLSDVSKGVMLFVSRGFEEVWGRTRESLYAAPGSWVEAIHPDDRERVHAAVSRQAAGAYDELYRIHRPDGELRWIRDRAFPVRDAAGVVYRISGIAQDVTDLRRAQETLREERDFTAKILDTVGALVIVLDTEARIVRFNRACEQTTGWRADEVLGRNVWETVIVPEDVAATRDYFASLCAGNFPSEYENFWRTKSGKRRRIAWSITGIVAQDGAVRYVIGAGIDVTEQRTLEEQYRQAQKMEAVGRLAGGIAHDFNNLLTVITGFADLVLLRLDDADPVRGDLEQIRGAALRAAGLTRQLLTFSRKQPTMPGRLELNRIVRDAEKLLRRVIGEDVALVIRLDPTPCNFQSDAGQVDQVIMNLAINARDAMPQGGKLTLETSTVELDADYAAAHADVAPGPYVLLAVSDTGHGMTAEVQSHIFEPFFTTKEPGKGTGLGLATVFGIVKQSAGHVTVYSEVGIGTTFKVYFPRSGGAAVAVTSTPPPLAKGTETVLVVEDEDLVRNLSRRMLELGGYKVLAARSGPEALALAAEYASLIHIVMTDVVMPEMNGKELAQRLTVLRPGIGVLFVSGYTSGALEQHGVVEEGLAFLQKPFTREALTRKIREVLDARAPS